MQEMAGNQIRFGIVGCAEIARKARKYAADNGYSDAIKVYGNYEAVLDDPSVDAVDVPLPTSLHLHWAVLAAEKKKHVLLEKPTTLHVLDLDQILRACDSNGVQFMGDTMWMHNPRTHRMREMLSNPTLFG
ncbi:hypothetical protein ACLOJK_016101 [Asimina triloba]